MGYYRINTLTNCAKKYGSFLNDYEPYQEIREFRHYENKFVGFSNTPIIFERDKSYKNDEPISDFLLNDWAEIIVSERIYKMLKEKYSDELDFYECFAKDEEILKPYYILRVKNVLDVLDKSFYSEIHPIFGVMRNILINDIPKKYNIFNVLYGPQNVISKQLYDDLKELNPTNFDVTPIATTSEEIKARHNLYKRRQIEKKKAVLNNTSKYDWTNAQRAELLKTGRIKGFQGCHLIDVSKSGNNLALIGNPDNIVFLERSKHLLVHGGSWKNATDILKVKKFLPWVMERLSLLGL